MKMRDGRFEVYGNAIKPSHSRQTVKWQEMFVRRFDYDPAEEYTLSLVDNEYLGPLFGVKEIVRGDQGAPVRGSVNLTVFSTSPGIASGAFAYGWA